ncbi:MAG: ABC transporter substrate-binding protein [Vicinamibacterales bacterium]
MAPADFLGRISQNPPKTWNDADIKSGGTVVRLSGRTPLFDMIPTTAHAQAGDFTNAVYSRLVRFANTSGLKNIMTANIEPDLATSWESPDDTTVIMTLAPNIKWQNVAPVNGRAFTVDDIKYSFNRGSTHKNSAWKAHYGLIKSVEDVGGGKVRLNLVRPYPPILHVLAFPPLGIMPREVGEDQALSTSTAIGTGGFMVEKHTPNVEVVYKRNPDFFKKDAQGRQRPYLDGFTISIVTDPATQQAQVEAGKADMAFAPTSPLTFDNAESIAARNKNIVLQRRPAAAPSFFLSGRYGQAPWSDLRVRQALSMLLDRDQLNRSLYKGYSYSAPYFPWPTIMENPPTPKDVGPNFAYNPAEAKKLLAAAGFANGMEMDLHWYVSGDIESQITIYQQAAAAGGVKLNLVKAADNATHRQKQLSKNWTGLFMVPRGLDFIDPQAVLSYFLPGNPLNTGEVDDPELVQLNTKLNTAKGDERTALGRQVWERMLSQQYEVALCRPDFLTWWSARTKNWRDTGLAANTGHGMGGMDQVWVS